MQQFRGGFRGKDTGDTCHSPSIPPPVSPVFHQKKNCGQAKIQKYNINKIYQIELRLKEMTYLIFIVGAKKTFSAFQLFHWRYRYNGSGKLIAAVPASNLKRSDILKSVNTSLCTLRKNKSSGTNAATESSFYKTANPEL